MSNTDVKKIEKDVIVRQIKEEDLEEIAALSLKCFGPDMALKHEHFANQLKLFPEGQICLEYQGKIIGNASSLIVDIDDYGTEHTYEEVSGKGYIRNHNPNGHHLYGIEIGVDPDYRKMKFGRVLYKGRQKICKDLNLKSIFIGGRMPFYYKYAKQLSAKEYVSKVMAGDIYDPVLTFQIKNGFKLRTIINNYLAGDTASLTYAALMEWENEEYVAK